MPTRVLLEGPAIEPLLEQVRREYGTSVRIISAEKVRTGGFGGFFAKQKYELSVEVPDEVMTGRQGGGPPDQGGGFTGSGGQHGGGFPGAGPGGGFPGGGQDGVFHSGGQGGGLAGIGPGPGGQSTQGALVGSFAPSAGFAGQDGPGGNRGGPGGGYGGGPGSGPRGTGGGFPTEPGQVPGFPGAGDHGSGGQGPGTAQEKPADTLAALLERADRDGFVSPDREQQTAQTVRNTYSQPELPARANLVSTASPAFAEVMAGLESGHLTRDPAEQRTMTHALAASGGAAPTIDVPMKPATPTVRPYRPPAATAPDGPPPPGVPMVSPALLEQLIAETNPLAPVVSQPPPAAPPMSTPMATATMAPEAPIIPVPEAPIVSVSELLTSPAPEVPIIPAAPASPERSALVPVHPALPAVPEKALAVVDVAPAKPVAEPEQTRGAKAVGPIAERLIELGMPETMAERATGTDAYGGVLEALADMPARPQPPARAGDVLVVAGELSHALPVARRVVDQLRLDASRLLLAGPSAAGTGIHPSRKISGPSAAEKKARKIHRGDTPYVVVLDAPVSEPNEEWVRDVCDALGATEVWAAVDATRKTADTRRHLSSMGDVEAVAVYGAAVTADPASVLGLDVPIFTVDGQEASPHTWAAMLCERMTQIEKKSTRKRRR